MSAVSTFAATSGILKVLLSVVTRPLAKVIAPFPGAVKVQVTSVKVVIPATASFVVVPPIVQVPVPALAVATTFAVADGPLLHMLLYWSFIVITGWVAKAFSLATPATGSCVTVKLATCPASIV